MFTTFSQEEICRVNLHDPSHPHLRPHRPLPTEPVPATLPFPESPCNRYPAKITTPPPSHPLNYPASWLQRILPPPLTPIRKLIQTPPLLRTVISSPLNRLRAEGSQPLKHLRPGKSFPYPHTWRHPFSPTKLRHLLHASPLTTSSAMNSLRCPSSKTCPENPSPK